MNKGSISLLRILRQPSAQGSGHCRTWEGLDVAVWTHDLQPATEKPYNLRACKSKLWIGKQKINKEAFLINCYKKMCRQYEAIEGNDKKVIKKVKKDN